MDSIKKYDFKDLNKKDLAHKVLKDIKTTPNMGLLRCVQCGMCASTCPAARNSDYDPRKMIKSVLDNDESVLDNDLIWNCFYCYTCHSICPVGNSACEVNQILRQMAIEKDNGKLKIKSFISFADNYISSGLGVIPQEYHSELSNDYGKRWDKIQENLEEIREELGLENRQLLSDAREEIGQTLNAIGFKKRVNSIKNVEEMK